MKCSLCEDVVATGDGEVVFILGSSICGDSTVQDGDPGLFLSAHAPCVLAWLADGDYGDDPVTQAAMRHFEASPTIQSMTRPVIRVEPTVTDDEDGECQHECDDCRIRCWEDEE